MTMAMAVSGQYQNSLVTGADWRALAAAVHVDPEEMTAWVNDVVSSASDALADAAHDERRWITDLPMTHHLVGSVAANSKLLLRWIDPPAVSRLDSVSVCRRAASRGGGPTARATRA